MKTKKIPFFEKVWNLIVPSRIKKKEKTFLNRAGIYQIPNTFYGIVFIVEVILAVILTAWTVASNINESGNTILWIVSSPFLFFALLAGIFIFSFLLYIAYMEIKIYNRVKKMEDVLPRFLEVLSINLRSGLTLNKAILRSLNDDFGDLNKEMIHVLKRTETGTSIENALITFIKKYNSPILTEVFELIVTSYKEGGKTAFLTETMVENIDNSNYLKKMVVASVMSYVIFISLVSLVLSPMLFALSFNLLLLTQSLIGKLLLAGKVDILPQVLARINIENIDFVMFSRIAVVVISTTAAAIISIIQKGSIKAGAKYIVLFAIASSLSYQFFLWSFTMFFQSLFGSVL